MKFNISTQHMKYGRKALDFALTQGYKRIGLLRKGLVLVRESLNRPVRDFQILLVLVLSCARFGNFSLSGPRL